MIYLDHHATTPCDRRVAEEMLSLFTEQFGNPHSTSHQVGREAAGLMEQAIASIAAQLRVSADCVLMTSGATESNNLAIDGICRHPRQKRRHVITSTIEHPAVLDVVDRLEKDGFRVSRVSVHPAGHDSAGQVNLDHLSELLDDDTAIVSIHWANNEIGTIQPMSQIASLTHQVGALLHSDATQAVGRIPVDLSVVDIDLLSASAHKFYGPKGVGFLTFAGGLERRRVRMKPLLVGGGQQRNLRSGTMSPPMIVGCAAALRYACEELDQARSTCGQLRDQLWRGLTDGIDGIFLNGASPEDLTIRLAGNLNVCLPGIEGETWMIDCPEIAFSSGSACSSTEAKPSHVLLGIGMTEQQARQSVRFGIGKWNTPEEIAEATRQLVGSYDRLTSV
ncbi:MAG: cysteine desulfurase family protein [Planctomycetota bacterium]